MVGHSTSLKEALFSEKNWIQGALIAGALGALFNWGIFVVPLLGILLSNFTFLPLFMSGFLYGYKGFGVSSAVFLGLPLIFLLSEEMSLTSLLTILPAFFAYVQSMRYRVSEGKPFFYPEGRLIVSLVCFLLVGLLIFCLSWYVSGQKEGIASLEQVFFQFFSAFFHELPLDKMPDQRIVGIISRFFPAITGISWFFVVFFNIHLALRFLAKWGAPLRRPPFVFESITIPGAFIWLLIGCGVLSLLGGDVGFLAQNSLGLILCAYVIEGIACLQLFWGHQNQGSFGSRKILLGIFYVSMVLFPWILLIVAGLGIFDSLLGLKEKRFKTTVPTKKD